MPRITRSATFKRLIADQSKKFRVYFSGLPPLLTGRGANLPAALAYQFHLVEKGHHRILYGCLCRMHDTNSVLAWEAVQNQHMTRPKFRDLFQNILGETIAEDVLNSCLAAEKVRDDLVHGKQVSDTKTWGAVQELTKYAIGLNAQVMDAANFEAFGDMRGVVGRRGSTPLAKKTSRWVLKGMGFDLG